MDEPKTTLVDLPVKPVKNPLNPPRRGEICTPEKSLEENKLRKSRKKRTPRKVETVEDCTNQIMVLIDRIQELIRTAAKVSWE